MSAALKVLTGNLRRRVLLLPRDRAPFLLGRSLEANLILPGPSVKERHAMVVTDAEGYRLVPAKGVTQVGEQVISEPHLLRDGDTIRIGQHLLVYQATSETVAASDEPDVRCGSCGEPVGCGAAGALAALSALRVGDERICPRCVDLRLHVDRDLEDYRILRKVGTNEEEVTYLAVDRETHQRVAIRIPKADRQARPAVFQRFLVRALVGLLLDHPNYLEVIGIRCSQGITYVVLEHLEQSTKLEVLIREQTPLGHPEAIYVCNQLSEILRFARERRVVVAKRKKSGVLVDRRFWVKVLAFDVTRELTERVVATTAFLDLAARSGVDPVAVAAEFPPADDEEARLSRLADEYAEAYSVGRILWQSLTGKPFGAGTIDLLRGLAGKPSPAAGPLAGCPPALIALLERVLVPRGPDRIRTLEGFTRASKAAYEALLANR